MIILGTFILPYTKGKKTLEIDDFQDYALSLDQCIRMIREAREGEMKLEESDEKKKVLYSLLMANGMPVEASNNGSNEQISNTITTKKISKKTKPGQRKPKRDNIEKSNMDNNIKSDTEIV